MESWLTALVGRGFQLDLVVKFSLQKSSSLRPSEICVCVDSETGATAGSPPSAGYRMKSYQQTSTKLYPSAFARVLPEREGIITLLPARILAGAEVTV